MGFTAKGNMSTWHCTLLGKPATWRCCGHVAFGARLHHVIPSQLFDMDLDLLWSRYSNEYKILVYFTDCFRNVKSLSSRITTPPAL